MLVAVGRELVECMPDGLRGSRVQAQPGTLYDDTGTNKIREVRELGANKVLDVDSMPFVSDEQILIGRKRVDAIGEALDEIFKILGDCLVSNRDDDAEHVFGAMIDLTHKKLDMLLVSFLLGHILGHANKQAPPVRLGSEGRDNNAPKALAAVFCADHPFGRMRLRLRPNDLADLLKHIARA